jgi:hypothetical protein
MDFTKRLPGRAPPGVRRHPAFAKIRSNSWKSPVPRPRVGRGHARQMNATSRKQWIIELQRNRQSLSTRPLGFGTVWSSSSPRRRLPIGSTVVDMRCPKRLRRPCPNTLRPELYPPPSGTPSRSGVIRARSAPCRATSLYGRPPSHNRSISIAVHPAGRTTGRRAQP